MYKRALPLASLFLMACGSQDATITVTCTNTIQAEGGGVTCTNSGNTVEGGNGAPPPLDASPCVQDVVSFQPWVRDSDGAASYGSMLVAPTGEMWRTSIAIAPTDTLLAVSVTLRPLVDDPVEPMTPSTLILIRNDDHQVIGGHEVAHQDDDTKAASYAEVHDLAMRGIYEPGEENGATLSLVFKGPVAPSAEASVVVESLPALLLETDCD